MRRQGLPTCQTNVEAAVNANAKMTEIVSLCSDYVLLSVQRLCPFV